jgi:hypothetical protein
MIVSPLALFENHNIRHYAYFKLGSLTTTSRCLNYNFTMC